MRSPSKTGTAASAPEAAPRPPRVLIVDDSKTQLAFTTAALSEAGFDVRVSDNVWIANVLAEFQPDLVLVDVNLAGGVSGPALIKAIRTRSLGSRARFVLYSTEPADVLARHAQDSGAIGWIRKDSNRALLAREVARLLEYQK